jgi:putative ABC transport system ATP-binding protein
LVAVTTTFAPRPGDGGAAVEATSLYRFFRAGDAQTLALQGVSISISAGELVVVSGPSGSGKCLAGIDNPDGGIVRTNGQRLSHRPEHVQAQMRSVHRLFVSDRKLLPHLNCYSECQTLPPTGDGRRERLDIDRRARNGHDRVRRDER